MTRPGLPIDPTRVSPRRRGGGPGEPASNPVPPQSETPHAWGSREASRQDSAKAGIEDETHSPFRIGAGGLVVFIVPAQLRAACASRGWSLAHLSTRAGISYPTLKSTLCGKPVRPRTAWKLARALGEGIAPWTLDGLVEAR